MFCPHVWILCVGGKLPDIVSRGAVITAHCRSRLCTGLYGAYTRPLRGGLTGFDNKQLCNIDDFHALPCLCT